MLFGRQWLWGGNGISLLFLLLLFLSAVAISGRCLATANHSLSYMPLIVCIILPSYNIGRYAFECRTSNPCLIRYQFRRERYRNSPGMPRPRFSCRHIISAYDSDILSGSNRQVRGCGRQTACRPNKSPTVLLRASNRTEISVLFFADRQLVMT